MPRRNSSGHFPARLVVPPQTLLYHGSRPVASKVRTFLKAADREEDSAAIPTPSFKPGDRIQVEVISFGPLGASVEVIGEGHDPDSLVPESDPPLGLGLILQKEIQYFRQGRDGVDVVRGEVLPAYVERVRDDGRIDVGLRSYGGKAKAQEAGSAILERLGWADGGTLPVGDKSSPEEIQDEFPGISKGSFKKAVSSLYKQGLVKPGPHSITLIRQPTENDN